jgi:hypothetical protein
MLAAFCLRLAAGMTACLLLLAKGGEKGTPGTKPLVHPNFFRTHFLIALGLTCSALLSGWRDADAPTLAALALGLALTFLGSLAWSLEGAPAGRAALVLTTLALAGALGLLEAGQDEGASLAGALAGAGTSAALLGAALSAMLVGHSYLIAPAMSLVPLFRLLAALAGALLARAAADAVALVRWTAAHSLGNLTGDALLWLPVRWAVGLLIPLGLCWMAWQTARIRSTQSATGILYVVVICCFLGELTALLLRFTGLVL